jgi:hypothetical protein
MCSTVSVGRGSVDAPRIPLSLLRSSQLGLACAPILCSHFPHGKEHGITCLALLFLAPLVPLLSGPFSTMLSLVSLRCYRSTHMSCLGYALSIVDTHLAVVLRFQPEFLPESDACQIVGSRYRIRKKARGFGNPGLTPLPPNKEISPTRLLTLWKRLLIRTSC